MRTTLNISEEILRETIAITNSKTKSGAINQALNEFIRRKRLERLINLRGKIHLKNNWKELREMEKNE